VDTIRPNGSGVTLIPCANPFAQFQTHERAIRSGIDRVLQSGHYILGAEIAEFEAAMRAYMDVPYAVGVASGTDALAIALRAFGIGAGDEVITVSHTAVATVAAILMTGATPVLVDVDPNFYTIDPGRVRTEITPNTKAVIAVHLYGQAADLDALMKIASDYKLKLIEDCAQATGARHKGRCVGTFGDAGAFSFYPTKNLGGIGDGGMIVSHDSRMAETAYRLRQYGWDDKRETFYPGFNSRLDPLQAAILSAKLPALDVDNKKRIHLASRYTTGLADLPLIAPAVRPDSQHVFHLYVVQCADRDNLRNYLAGEGIEAGIHYPKPAHKHGGYTERMRLAAAGLATTDRLVSRILSLPLYPELTGADVDRIVDAIRRFYQAHLAGDRDKVA